LTTNNSIDIQKRKLTAVGQGTYTVSIPKAWITEMKLCNKDKDEDVEVVLLKRPENSAVIFFEKSGQDFIPRKLLIVPAKDEKVGTTVRKVVSAYLNGCNEIIISTKDLDESVNRELTKRLQRLVQDRLAHSELTYRSNNPQTEEPEAMLQITVNLDYNKDTVNVEELLAKIYRETINIHDNIINAIMAENPDPRQAYIMWKHDIINDRSYFTIIRALKEAAVNEAVMPHIGVNSLRECLGYRQIASNFERISDHSSKIGKAFCNLVGYQVDEKGDEIINANLEVNIQEFRRIRSDPNYNNFVEQFKKLDKEAMNIFKKSVNCLMYRKYSESDDLIEEVEQDTIKETRKLLDDIPTSIPSKYVRVFSQMIESVGRIPEYSRGTMQIALNLIFYEAILKAKPTTTGNYGLICPEVATPREVLPNIKALLEEKNQ
jgi:phosphate uptake regulator